VAEVLKEHTEITKVLVEGHTDNRGGKGYNQALSERRAKSVMKWLVKHGIDAKRLEAKGFGQDRPIADNTTEEGRQKNRRVEFKILATSAPSTVGTPAPATPNDAAAPSGPKTATPPQPGPMKPAPVPTAGPKKPLPPVPPTMKKK
jgi:hypothetical protein